MNKLKYWILVRIFMCTYFIFIQSIVYALALRTSLNPVGQDEVNVLIVQLQDIPEDSINRLVSERLFQRKNFLQIMLQTLKSPQLPDVKRAHLSVAFYLAVDNAEELILSDRELELLIEVLTSVQIDSKSRSYLSAIVGSHLVNCNKVLTAQQERILMSLPDGDYDDTVAFLKACIAEKSMHQGIRHFVVNARKYLEKGLVVDKKKFDMVSSKRNPVTRFIRFLLSNTGSPNLEPFPIDERPPLVADRRMIPPKYLYFDNYDEFIRAINVPKINTYDALGRTAIGNIGASKRIGFKFLRNDEAGGRLNYEHKWYSLLNKLKHKLKLRSKFPKPITTANGSRVFKVKADCLPKALQARLDIENERSDGALKLDCEDGYCTLIVYEAEADYFRYITDTDLSDGEFGRAVKDSIHDLFTLAKYIYYRR